MRLSCDTVENIRHDIETRLRLVSANSEQSSKDVLEQNAVKRRRLGSECSVGGDDEDASDDDLSPPPEHDDRDEVNLVDASLEWGFWYKDTFIRRPLYNFESVFSLDCSIRF